jgi:hypothetical protein
LLIIVLAERSMNRAPSTLEDTHTLLAGFWGCCMMKIEQNKASEIVALVKRYLEPHQPEDYRLQVHPAIQQEDDWYYVLVTPTKEDAPSYDYNARMVEAEMELQAKEHLQVLLVPVFPD